MKKTTLAMSALALSLGLALSPLSASAAETASSATNAQQMPNGPDAGEGDAVGGEH